MATMMEANTRVPQRMAGPAAAQWLIGIAVASVALGGCGHRNVGHGREQKQEVIVCVAVEESISRPVLDEFSQETGIQVRLQQGAGEGLASEALQANGKHACDLLWNDDILETLRLEQQGLLRPTTLLAGSNYDARHRSKQGAWYGFAARARVLIVNTNQLNEARYPKTVLALADPQWRDRVGVAKPVSGTSATHVACLFVALGDDEGKRLVRSMKNNSRLLASNRDVAARVAAGTLAFGLTDSDAAMAEVEAGSPVAIVYPDQREGELGTLFLPHTLALLKGSEHTEAADRLAEYLLSSKVEDQLVAGPTAAVPLNKTSQATPRIETPKSVKGMEVDFQAVAEKWGEVERFLGEEFGAGR